MVRDDLGFRAGRSADMLAHHRTHREPLNATLGFLDDAFDNPGFGR